MLKRIFHYSLIIIVCFAVACKADLKKTVVGKWKTADSRETWEFKSDKSFTLMKTVGADSLSVSGTYAVEDDQTLLLTAKHNVSGQALEPIRGKVTINGDEMTFKDPEGAHILKRVSETSQEKSNTPQTQAGALSEEDKYKLAYAASVSQDADIQKQMFRLLGEVDEKGEPDPAKIDVKFGEAMNQWVEKNSGFKKEVDTPEKARAYFKSHFPGGR